MNLSSEALADQVRAFVAERRETRNELLSERDKIQARRAALLAMPLNRDDAKQFIFDYIDTRAAEYPNLVGWPALFETVAYPMRYNWLSQESKMPETGKRAPLCMRDVDAALNGSASEHLAVFDGGLRFFGAAHQVNVHTDLAAYFFFGDAIKAKIDKHFDQFFPNYHSADAARIGPSLAERQRELAQLALAEDEVNETLARVNAELAELAPPRELAATVETTIVATQPVDVPPEAIARYNGKNEIELGQKYNCPAAAILAAWHAAERERRKPSGQGIVSLR